jgi:hypothetical protein
MGKNIDSKHFRGLVSEVYMSILARNMLNQNLWIRAGLVNGTICIIDDIFYLPNEKPPSLPSVVMLAIEKEDYYGPSFYNDDHPKSLANPTKAFVPVHTVTYNCDLRDKFKQFSREAHPFDLAYAITVHNSQGGTFPLVMIDLGKSEFSLGLTYTGCSRTSGFANMLFSPMPDYRRFCKKLTEKAKANLQDRLNEDERLLKMYNENKNMYQELVKKYSNKFNWK